MAVTPTSLPTVITAGLTGALANIATAWAAINNLTNDWKTTASLVPGVPYSVPIATCIAATSRTQILTRTDVPIRAYGPGTASQIPPWFIEGFDYWDLIPNA